MTSSDNPKDTQKEKVLVTGFCGALGRLVAQNIHPKRQVVGVDRRPYYNLPEGIVHHRLDLRRKSAINIVKKEKPDVIIHMGVIRNPLKHKLRGNAYHFNLESTSQLMELSRKLKIRKFVFLSTANLYGPSATSSSFLTEDAPLHGANRSPEIRDLVALDMMIQSFFWKEPSIETVILRPVHILGPSLNNAPSRYFRQEKVPTILGFDPVVQIIHEDDMVRAISAALRPGIQGVFNVVGDGQAPLSRLLRHANKSSFGVPETVLRLFLQRAFKYNLTLYPPGELDHIKYSCLVDGGRFKKAVRFQPSKNLAETIEHL